MILSAMVNTNACGERRKARVENLTHASRVTPHV
jgi:hypothetical protein